MTTDTLTERELPQGVWRFTRGWVVFMVIAAAVVLFGAFAYSRQLSEGLITTGLRDLGASQGAPWGLYVAFDVYFAGASFAGITIAALIRLFNIERLKPVARMAEVLTIVSLLLAGLAIMADLGQPLRGLFNLFKFGRPQSPFFGTYSMVIAGYLFSSVIFLYLTGRADAAKMAEKPSQLRWYYRMWSSGYRDTPDQRKRDRTASFWLAIAILPLLVIAHSSLGFVFGLQVGRPGWFGALQAPAFVALAGVSGLGHLIVLAAIVRRTVDGGKRITLDAFAWLGRLLMVLAFAYLYFTIVEMLTTVYQADVAEQSLSQALLSGRYAWIFWGSVASLALPALALAYMAVRKTWRLSWVVAAGAVVNFGAIGKRFLVVVPSETHAQLIPYGTGSYSPSWIEYSVILGLMALGALLIGLFIKTFPIMELEEADL